MATPLLKICGLRISSQAAAIAALGADAIGVIAVPGSPRFLDLQQRPALFAAVKRANPGCLGVVVVADPAADALDTLQAVHGHDVVQLHGGESPERCAQLRALLPGLALWKALRIRSEADLAQVEQYHGVVDAVLLDASSALEHSPGDKDLTRVRQLVAVVRATRQDRSVPSAPPLSPCS